MKHFFIGLPILFCSLCTALAQNSATPPAGDPRALIGEIRSELTPGNKFPSPTLPAKLRRLADLSALQPALQAEALAIHQEARLRLHHLQYEKSDAGRMILARALISQASIIRASGQTEEASGLVRESSRLLDETGPGQSGEALRQWFTALQALGAAWMDEGNYALAAETLEKPLKAYPAATKTGDDAHLQALANMRSLVAQAYLVGENQFKSAPAAHQALAAWQTLADRNWNENQAGFLRALLDLAEAHLARNDFRNGYRFLTVVDNASRGISLETQGELATVIATKEFLRGSIHASYGEYVEAQSSLDAALGILRRVSGELSVEQRLLLAKTLLYSTAVEAVQAGQLMHSVHTPQRLWEAEFDAKLRNDAQASPLIAHRMQRIREQFAEIRSLLAPLMKTAPGQTQTLQALAWREESTFHSDMGRYSDAITPLENALTLIRRLYDKDPTNFAPVLADLLTVAGDNAYSRNSYSVAIQLYEEARGLHNRLSSEQRARHDPSSASLLAKIGRSQGNLRNDAAALSAFAESEQIWRRLLQINKPLYRQRFGLMLFQLGVTHMLAERDLMAVNAFREDYELNRARRSEHNLQYICAKHRQDPKYCRR